MRQRSVSAQELSYYRAHLREAIREDGVVCLECGGVYQALLSHLPAKHRMTLAEYRERWGYKRGRGLISGAVRERKRQVALERNFGAMGPPGAIWQALAVQRQRGGLPPKRLETLLENAEAVRARYAAGWRHGEKVRKVGDEVLRALVAEGLTRAEIAARTGLHGATVRRRIRALGLSGPGLRPAPLPVPATELVALRQAGLSDREIAQRTGLTVQGVRGRFRTLRRHGAPVPAPPALRGRGQVTDEGILALAESGLGPAAIAARVERSESAVRARLRRRRGVRSAS